jgi:hypothetical protein
MLLRLRDQISGLENIKLHTPFKILRFRAWSFQQAPPVETDINRSYFGVVAIP